MGHFIDKVPGQEKPVNLLNKLCLSKRIPHALLFTGPKGVGKHLTAVQFAKELSFGKESDFSSIANKIDHLEEPYIKFIHALPRGKSETNTDMPTAKLDSDQIKNILEQLNLLKKNPYHELSIEKAQNIKISSIRDLRKFLALDYAEVPYRFIIIYEAQMMSIDSQNALLKNLEEPPVNVIFILHSSNPDLLLSTIKSRCQEIKFSPLPQNVLENILIDKFEYEKETARIISRFSDGSVIKAKKLLDDKVEIFLENCINILRYSLARRYHTAFEYFNNIIEVRGEEGFYTTLDFMIKWFTDVIRNRAELDLEFFRDHEETVAKFNNKFHNYELSEIIDKLESLGSTRQRNINLNICVSNVIFQIGRIGIG